MMEPINNVDIAELVVIPKRKPGYMKGVVVLPFEFDLGRARWSYHETYHGHTYSLNHVITVQLDRPWYTFDVLYRKPLTLERISTAPKVSVGTVPDTDAAKGQAAPHELLIPDYVGDIRMDYSVDSYDLDGVLKASVVLDAAKAPIEYLSVMIVREEFSGGIVCEDLMHEVVIHDGVVEDEDEDGEERAPGDAIEQTIEVVSGEVRVKRRWAGRRTRRAPTISPLCLYPWSATLPRGPCSSSLLP